MHTILLTLDSNYIQPAFVLIESIRRTNVTIWRDIEIKAVLTDGSQESRARLEALSADGTKIEVIDFMEVDVSLATSTREDMKRVGPAGLARLYLDRFVPQTCEKLLYLDCDVLCLGSIADLLNTNMHGYTIAAVQDARARYFEDYGGLPGVHLYQNLSLKDPYFNSGVMLVNVARWRRRDIERNCIEYLRATQQNLRYCDQDALNVASHGDWKALDQKWNYMSYWELDDGSQEDVRLVHFIDSSKPWQETFPHGRFRRHYLS